MTGDQPNTSRIETPKRPAPRSDPGLIQHPRTEEPDPHLITEEQLNTSIKSHYRAVFIALALTALACGYAPTVAKTDYEIARETVDCMLQNDPNAGFGILMMGGKDAYARTIEQGMARPGIIEFRDEVCRNRTPRPPTPTNQNPLLQSAYSTQKSNPTNQASKATPPTGSPNSAIPKSAAPTPQRSLAFHHNGPPVQNRFLDLPYDASKTLNNRQAPANQRNCAGGSKPLTRWSRTHEIQDQGALIADARGETTRVVELHFARIHPGRGYLQDNCPEEHILAQATLVTVHGNPPDLTEYVALWQDHAGNEITRDDARDGISIELPVSLNPEALYEGPARLLIYDQYILGTQPTLTPETEAAPYQKEFSLHIDPTTWPVDAQRNQIKGMYYWSEVAKHSPDPAPRHIYDVQGNEWHLDTIGVVEKHHTRLGANPTADWAEYTVTFSNHSRAYADFTGYLIQISTPDGTSVATNHWQRPEGLELIGSTTFTVRIPTELQGALQLKALDPYEQSPVEK